MRKLTIGNLAKQANVNVQTIRYYERRRLLPEPKRTAAGYRVYSTDAIQRINFVKSAQGLGFSLKEIGELIGLRLRRSATCADVRKRAEAKIAEIESKIENLQAMRKSLLELTDACSGGPVSNCSILLNLDCRRPFDSP